MDRYLDPKTGDYVDAPGGSYKQTDDVTNAITMSLTIPLGSWEGDPELGHRFDELAREGNTVQTRLRLHDLVGLALAWLKNAGRLATIEVEVIELTAEAVGFIAACTTPSGEKVTVGPLLVPIGGK